MKYLQQNVQRERKQKRRKPSAHFNYYRICSKIRDPSIIILIIITNSVSLTHKFLRHYFFLLRLLFCFCAVRQVCACLGTYYLKKYFFLISSKWLFWSISLLEFHECCSCGKGISLLLSIWRKMECVHFTRYYNIPSVCLAVIIQMHLLARKQFYLFVSDLNILFVANFSLCNCTKS